MILWPLLSKFMIIVLKRIEWNWDMLNKKKMRIQMSLYVYVHLYHCISSRYSDTNDMRWQSFRARLNTHRGFGPCVWALLPVGGICMWLMIIGIQMLRYIWYRWDIGLLCPFEYTQRLWAMYLAALSFRDQIMHAQIWWDIWDMRWHFPVYPL